MQICFANNDEGQNLQISEIQDGTHWKLKIRHISAAVQPIATKFCTNMQVVAVNRAKS